MTEGWAGFGEGLGRRDGPILIAAMMYDYRVSLKHCDCGARRGRSVLGAKAGSGSKIPDQSTGRRSLSSSVWRCGVWGSLNCLELPCEDPVVDFGRLADSSSGLESALLRALGAPTERTKRRSCRSHRATERRDTWGTGQKLTLDSKWSGAFSGACSGAGGGSPITYRIHVRPSQR